MTMVSVKFLLLVMILAQLAQIHACPSHCTCELSEVFCSRRQLTDIPPGVPPKTELLDLSQNQLRRLPRKVFKDLKYLRQLRLDDNHIEKIEDGAFDGLENLQRLWLLDNRIRSLSAGAFIGMPQLWSLKLDSNDITEITPGVFKPLANLRWLHLHHNHLTHVPGDELRSLSQLEAVTLHGNDWECSCELADLTTFLGEHTNKLRFDSGVPTPPAICARPQHLMGDQIHTLSKDDLCVPREETPDSAGDKTCPAPCNCRGAEVDCDQKGLTSVPAGIPSTTTELILSNNNIRDIPPDALVHLKKLQMLLLSNNQLQAVPKDALRKLPDLAVLYLDGNSITNIAEGTFDTLASLRVLSLANNEITKIEKESFWRLTNLQNLYLHQNSLADLNPRSLNLKKLPALKQVSLYGNKWDCSCPLRDFIAYVQRNKQVLYSGDKEATSSVDTRVTCTGPEKYRGTDLTVFDLPALEAECK
ncbi:PREDICTED: slit homolog 2 protein-like [Branchiostoma belcheri]|uniref:Slit homolog 2 protein-like n=1 Tax=Branchiostoma belcheri TaxID=7741 RepID=A0A6P5ANF9_BRABE|nr:PREDICTED: slit homolog 2 protein-like [Branchiostoma belcheri]